MHAGGSARQPFFLVVAYHAPHSPLQALDECCAPFRQRGDLNDAVATLYGMVARMDHGIGQILGALDAAGCADDTVVLVTSDNGPWLGADRHGGGRVSMRRFNGPFRGQKQEVLEGGIRVPAIVRWPAGLPAGAACDDMIHFCDWLPTLAAAAGATPEGLPLDGCNQLPRLRGTPEAGAAPVSGSSTATIRCPAATWRCVTAPGSCTGRASRRRWSSCRRTTRQYAS